MRRRQLMIGAAAAMAAGPVLAQAPKPWESLRTTTPLPPARDTGRLRVDDVELYYAVYGKGNPVLLLHPGLGHADYWANQIGPLSQGYQVVVIDQRGHGRSTRSDAPLTYERLAADAVSVIKQLHLKDPVVVGWGDGATTGLEMALHYPDRLRKLVAFGLTYDTSGLQPGVDQTQTFIDYVHKTMADYERLAPPPQDFTALLDQLEAMWATEPHYSESALASITTPVAVIAAEHDEWVLPAHMKKAADLIPGAQIVAMQNVSHFAPWQNPKTFNDIVRLLLI